MEIGDRIGIIFREYDYVELTEALEKDLPAGTRGAIVMVYAGAEQEYEVEFVDKDGETIAIRTVKENQLRKIDAEGAAR